MGGVVFDVSEDHLERFMDVFTHLKETDSRIDFGVSKCAELPELLEESGFENPSNGNWRTSSSGGDEGGFGGQRHQRYQSFGGNQGGYFNNGNGDKGSSYGGNKYGNGGGGGYGSKGNNGGW
jgi:hypothetical protein